MANESLKLPFGLAEEAPEPSVSASFETRLTEIERINRDLAEQNEKLKKKLEKKLAKEEAEWEVKNVGAGNESQASSPERWRIVIEEGREKHAARNQFIGVNGRGYYIRRGVEVDVPPEVIEVLKHAVEIRSISITNEMGMVIDTEEREIRRFPYSVIGKAIDSSGKRLLPEIKEPVKKA